MSNNAAEREPRGVAGKKPRRSVWKMTSARAIGRTAKVAGPLQVAYDPAPNVAKDVPAADCLEFRIRQLADFQVLLRHVLHCMLLFRSGGPFRRRWGDNAAAPFASL